MAITVNTNIPSLTAQKSLNNATSKMNTAMERMTTGLKINSSKDDAAGMAVANKLDYKISSLNVAQSNGQMGTSMLDTAEGVLNVINDNLVRIRDLTEQAANGTYGSDAMTAIETEVQARMDEITRLAESSEFNGKILFNPNDADKNGIKENIKLQVGINHKDQSVIELDKKLFADAKASTILKVTGGKVADKYENDSTARAFLENIDKALEDVTSRTTLLGGYQQRIISAMDAAGVMETNLTSAKSLIEDADIAEESSNYIKQQILQQTSASLLATANQAPSIALNLV